MKRPVSLAIANEAIQRSSLIQGRTQGSKEESKILLHSQAHRP